MILKRLLINIRILIALIISLSLVAYTPNKNKDLKPIGAKKLYKNIVKNYVYFNEINLKANIKLTLKDKSYNLKVNIRIKKDSLIWINLSHSSGVSVARILLTNDSIKVLNRIDKVYYTGNYKYFSEKYKLNFDFKTLQGIFLNELIDFSKRKKYEKVFEDFKSGIDSSFYVYKNYNDRIIKKQKKKNKTESFVLEKFIIIPESFKIKEIHIEDLYSSRELTINYDNFKSMTEFSQDDNLKLNTCKLFPKKIVFNLSSDKLKTSFTINYNKVRINKKSKYSFKIPDSYEIKYF